MPTARSNLTAKIGTIEFNCIVEWRYNPGEKMVRYYADGSGYPGSPPEFDCVESVEIAECEYPVGRPAHYYSDELPEDWGDTTEWGYADSNDRPDAFAIAERWIRDDIESGMYQDELFDNAEDDDYDD